MAATAIALKRACMLYSVSVSESWAAYVTRISRGVDQTEIAERTGINASVISRWIRGETRTPRPHHAQAFAKGYGRPVLEALVVAGILAAEDIEDGLHITELSLTELPTDELLRELRRRVGDDPKM